MGEPSGEVFDSNAIITLRQPSHAYVIYVIPIQREQTMSMKYLKLNFKWSWGYETKLYSNLNTIHTAESNIVTLFQCMGAEGRIFWKFKNQLEILRRIYDDYFPLNILVYILKLLKLYNNNCSM